MWNSTNNNSAQMRNTVLPNGETQSFYHGEDHPTMPDWFKGMEEIIWERFLWPDSGLLSQCKGFKCVQEKTDCCCCRLLFTQPDFIAQKSKLEEFVTSRGHICNFYPKYHCELNFIEQYWGAAKLYYCNTPKTSNIIEMEKNMLACLDDIPLLQIQRWIHSISSTILAVNSSILRYANWSARFIMIKGAPASKKKT